MEQIPQKPHKYVRRSGAEVGSRLCWGLRGKAGLGVQRIKDSFIQKPLRISALNWMQLTECDGLCRGGGWHSLSTYCVQRLCSC